MSTSGRQGLILASLACHGAATALKLTAGVATGALPLVAAGVHGLADVMAQVFLLQGNRRATRPADARHPFGYAKELYFWSLIGAVLLYSLGAGVALFAGTQAFIDVPVLLHPPPAPLPVAPSLAYGALAATALLQGAALFLAIRSLASHSKDQGWLALLRAAREPVVFACTVEAIVALAGTAVAVAGMLAMSAFDVPLAGGAAAVAIGCLMFVLAAFMAMEVKSLLVGRPADALTRSALSAVIRNESGPGRPIAAVNAIRTLHLGPDEVLVTAGVAFDGSASVATVEETVGRLRTAVQSVCPQATEVSIVAEPADPVAQRKALAVERAERKAQERPARDEASPASAPVASDETARKLAALETATQDGRSAHANRKARKKKRRH